MNLDFNLKISLFIIQHREEILLFTLKFNSSKQDECKVSQMVGLLLSVC